MEITANVYLCMLHTYLDCEGGSLLADVMAKADQIPSNADENRTWESESETSYETSVTGTFGLDTLFNQE